MARKRRRNNRKIRKNVIYRKIYLYVSIVIAVGIAGVVLSVAGIRFLYSRYFKVDRIITEEVLDRDIENYILGKNIFNLDIKKVHGQLLSRNPEYKYVEITKQLPSVVNIHIEKRAPFFQLKIDNMYVVLDRDFFVISEYSYTPYDNLIIVETDGIKTGMLKKEKVVRDPRLIRVAQLIDAIKQIMGDSVVMVEKINAYRLSSLSFIFKGVNVIVGEGRYSDKISLFRDFLLNKFKQDLSSLNYIDLRSQKPYFGYRR